MNITDVDDKIINKSNEENKHFKEVTSKYEKDFFEDMKILNVELPDVITRVSEFIPEIINYIKKIEERGYAYRSNGSVYFNVSQFSSTNNHSYGKLKPGENEKKT